MYGRKKKRVMKIENLDPECTRFRAIPTSFAINPQSITSSINQKSEFLWW